MAHHSEDEVIYEFRSSSGRSVQVAAMHPPTLTEVTIVGDSGHGQSYLRDVALRKLDYVLRKNGHTGLLSAAERGETPTQPAQEAESAAGPAGRGTRVRKDRLGLLGQGQRESGAARNAAGSDAPTAAPPGVRVRKDKLGLFSGGSGE